MKTETITWHELPQDGRPDSDTTVLAEITQDDGSTDVHPAWWDGEEWRDCAQGWPLDTSVVAWAHVPAGATAC